MKFTITRRALLGFAMTFFGFSLAIGWFVAMQLFLIFGGIILLVTAVAEWVTV